MKINITITNEAITDDDAPIDETDCGAMAEFRGVVRGEENGARIAALDYQAYQPMAQRQMERILCELATDSPCEAVSVTHRVGLIPVGEASILVRVAAIHRAEAFALLANFMDRLKQDVPIWKVATKT